MATIAEIQALIDNVNVDSHTPSYLKPVFQAILDKLDTLDGAGAFDGTYSSLTGKPTIITAADVPGVLRSSATTPVDGTGANGDFHLDTVTGKLYKRATGTYSEIADLY